MHALEAGALAPAMMPALVAVIANNGAFILFVFLHAISALVGFGSVGFAGTYAGRAAHMAASGELVGGPRANQLADGGEASASATSPSAVGLTSASVVAASEPLEHTGRAGEPAVPGTPGVVPGAAGTAATDGGPSHGALGSASSAGDKQVDPEVEELVRYFERPARFWKAVLAVPVFGVLALVFQPNGKGIDQVWAVTALIVWLIATILIAGVAVPALRHVTAMLPTAAGVLGPTEPQHGAAGPTVPEALPGRSDGSALDEVARVALRARVRRSGSLASRAAAACDLLFFVALALMIWRP